MVEQPTSATIQLSAIRDNFALAQKQSAGRDPIAVIKADAYGHGAVRVAQALTDAGCRRFAVATVPEAVSLRDSGVRAPILVLGGVWGREEAQVAVARELVPVIHHDGHLECRQRHGGVAGAEHGPNRYLEEFLCRQTRLNAFAEADCRLA